MSLLKSGWKVVVTKNQFTKAKDPVILLDSTYLETEETISRTSSTVKTDFKSNTETTWHQEKDG